MRSDRGTRIKSITALMIAVFMIAGHCIPALAAGLTDDHPASDELLIQAQEGLDISADTLITDEADEAGADGLIEEDEFTAETGKSADSVLNDLMSGKEFTADTALPVSGSDYEITRYPSRITVKNKAALKDNEPTNGKMRMRKNTLRILAL